MNFLMNYYCSHDFVRSSLDNPSVLSVLQEVTSGAEGRTIRAELTVGQPPTVVSAPAAPVSPAPAAAGPDPAAPQDRPPWEAPAGDRLEELARSGSQLEHFKIQ